MASHERSRRPWRSPTIVGSAVATTVVSSDDERVPDHEADEHDPDVARRRGSGGRQARAPLLQSRSYGAASVRAPMDGIKRIDLLPGAPPAEQMRRQPRRPARVPDRSRLRRSRAGWSGRRRRSARTPSARCTAAILGLIVDDVCGMAFASLLTEFVVFPTISMQLEFHRPIQIGETVECRGTVVRIGRRFVVADAVVRGRRRQAPRPRHGHVRHRYGRCHRCTTAGSSPASPLWTA